MYKVDILKGGQAYVQRKEIKTQITIHVKVFHGSRPTHTFQVSIHDPIQEALDIVREKDGLELQNSKLIYPMGYLRNLSECL